MPADPVGTIQGEARVLAYFEYCNPPSVSIWGGVCPVCAYSLLHHHLETVRHMLCTLVAAGCILVVEHETAYVPHLVTWRLY